MTDAELVSVAKKASGLTLTMLARKVGVTERMLQYLLNSDRDASQKLRKKLEALVKVRTP